MRDETSIPQALSPDDLRWDASEDGPHVSIAPEAVNGIESEVLRAFESRPPRGEETAGVLYGSHDPKTGILRVEGWQPVDIDNPAALQQARTDGRGIVGLSLVGLYRSQTRPGLHVTPDDCAAVEGALPRSTGILLLIKPLSALECVATIFVCEGGAVIDRVAAEREIPFTRKMVPRNGAGPEPAAAVPVAKGTALRISPWIPVTALAVGIGVAAFFHYRTAAPPNEQPVPVQAAPGQEARTDLLGLHAERNGSITRLLWNPASPAITDARGAELSIRDAKGENTRHLSNRDLRTGVATVNAPSGDVAFEMRVSRPDSAVVAESAGINSSSDTPAGDVVPKPSPLVNPSRTADEPRPANTRTETRLPDAGVRTRQAEKPGRLKRFFGGVGSKASHLWPFHSNKREQR